jgi:S1-C subfamily serine protease
VVVDKITSGSAYELGGGQVNDVVTTLDGEPITTMEELLTELRTRRAGEEVTIAVLRGDSGVNLEITLGALS